MLTIGEGERAFRRCSHCVPRVTVPVVERQDNFFRIWGLPKCAKTSLDWLDLKGGLGGVNSLVTLRLAALSHSHENHFSGEVMKGSA